MLSPSFPAGPRPAPRRRGPLTGESPQPVPAGVEAQRLELVGQRRMQGVRIDVAAVAFGAVHLQAAREVDVVVPEAAGGGSGLGPLAAAAGILALLCGAAAAALGGSAARRHGSAKGGA